MRLLTRGLLAAYVSTVGPSPRGRTSLRSYAWPLVIAATIACSPVADSGPHGSTTSNSSPQARQPVDSFGVGESLVWSGARAGSLTKANTQCPAPQGGYLFQSISASRYVSISLSQIGSDGRYIAGTYSSKDSVGLYLGDDPGGSHLYLSVNATVTVEPGGLTGSASATLAPQSAPGGALGTPSILLSGTWRCVAA